MQASTPIHLISYSTKTVYHLLHTLITATNMYESENNNQTTYFFIKYVSTIKCSRLAHINLQKLDIKRKCVKCSI